MAAERKKVLYVQPNSEIGGSDITLLRMVEALDRDRFDPVVLLPFDGPLVPRLREFAADVRFLPMMQLRTLLSPSYQARYLARFWPTVSKIRGLIRDEGITLVHTNSLYSLYAPFAARAERRPHIWHLREIPPAIPVARPALGSMVLALSKMVLAMSRACTEGLLKERADLPKVHVLYDGLDLTRWSRERIDRSIRSELGIAPEAPLVGFVARLDPWKGLDVYLEAASIIKSRFPNAVFLVAGDAPAGFEAYRDRMIARAAELGLADSVRFVGWRFRPDDVPALMASLDIFSHTSIQPEPFGLVLIEAMAMGCPVVASKGGGPLEIVEDGVSGLLTPLGDAQANAEAVCALLADPDRRQRFAAAARLRVEQRFSKDVFREGLRQRYREVLGGATA